MKTYEIILLTPAGFRREIYTDSQPLEQFEQQMLTKHGQFITHSCNEVKTGIPTK